MSSTADTRSSRKTIINFVTQSLISSGSTLTEEVNRKWAEALVTLYDQEAKDELVDHRKADRRVRDLHERRDSDTGSAYCDVCANHGDTVWPCATIRALGVEK